MKAIIGKSQKTVTTAKTAKALGSGTLEVLATPALVALMEEAACNAIQHLLKENQTTVGTQISVDHLAATRVGMDVWAQATMIEKQGRKYVFEMQAFDEKELIATGHHQRVEVDSERFLKKASTKKEA